MQNMNITDAVEAFLEFETEAHNRKEAYRKRLHPSHLQIDTVSPARTHRWRYQLMHLRWILSLSQTEAHSRTSIHPSSRKIAFYHSDVLGTLNSTWEIIYKAISKSAPHRQL